MAAVINKWLAVRPSALHGLGIFARTRIPAGTRILVETPLCACICDATLAERRFGKIDSRAFVRHVVESMPPEDRQNFVSLHNSQPGDRDMHFSIARTNGIRMFNGPGMGASANVPFTPFANIFALTSRFNHSCIANARSFWDWGERNEHWRDLLDGSKQITHTLVDIEPNSEICFDYQLQYRPEIQRPIREASRIKRCKEVTFACKCAVCSLPTADLKAVDKKRRLLDDTWIGMYRLAESDVAEALGRIGLVVELVKELKLHWMLPMAYNWALEISIIKGDDQAARDWAFKAAYAYRVAQGDLHGKADKCYGLATAPGPSDNPLYGTQGSNFSDPSWAGWFQALRAQGLWSQ